MSPLTTSKVTKKQNYAEMANLAFNYKVHVSIILNNQVRIVLVTVQINYSTQASQKTGIWEPEQSLYSSLALIVGQQ